MSHPVIEADECIGCGICVDACPQEVLEVVNGVADAVNEEACIACGDCVEECPMGLSRRSSRTNSQFSVSAIERGVFRSLFYRNPLESPLLLQRAFLRIE